MESSVSNSDSKKGRCKKGTKKYTPIGDGCYTKEEIEKFKADKSKKTRKNKKKDSSVVVPVVNEEAEAIIEDIAGEVNQNENAIKIVEPDKNKLNEVLKKLELEEYEDLKKSDDDNHI